MKTSESLRMTDRILVAESVLATELSETEVAQKLINTRKELLEHLREVGKGGDLGLIVATEKFIVQVDLDHYSNSRGMASSLKAALVELNTAQRHMAMVGDIDQYKRIDEGHSLPRNRKSGLPWDEARQAFHSHYARLNNLDKSRLADEEKSIIDARKTNIWNADRQYAAQQAKTLGVELKNGAKRSGGY